MYKPNKNQVLSAFNRIRKEEKTEDNVPMTCGKYVIKLTNPEDYNVLFPFISTFVTRQYRGEFFDGAVDAVVCDCTHILMGDNGYLSFRDENSYKRNMKNLEDVICDFFTLLPLLECDEDDADEELFEEEE